MSPYGLKKESEEGYDRYLLCVADNYYTVTDSSTLTLNPSKVDEEKFEEDMRAFENNRKGNWVKVSEKDIPERIIKACMEDN